MSYLELKREAKSQRIFFSQMKFSEKDSKNVPEDHKDTFKVIQELGQIRHYTYGHVPNANTPQRPWVSETKRRAAKIQQYAARCRRENRNEDGWRFEVEYRLFERFDIEVACTRCRKRLWRSEIEANPAQSNSRTGSLSERQKNREPCKCSPAARNDCLDSGTSELFSSRIGEFVYDSREPSISAVKIKKKPDRIHGLRCTRNFDLALSKPYAHDESEARGQRAVGDVLNISANPDTGGEPLLFPFLVMEAKREKGADNFEYMEVQSALPIKNALKIQYDLQKAPGNTAKAPGGPLVWFLANRGEDWRVYAAVVVEEDDRPNYWVHHLWSGSIYGIDEALQLILILDYVIDWARDMYRPNTLRQLNILGATSISDAATFVMDPDVYSLYGGAEPQINEQESEPLRELSDPDVLLPDPNVQLIDVSSLRDASPLEDEPLQDSLAALQTDHGLVRDMRHIDSRIRGLYLTRDNFETFKQGFDTEHQARGCVRVILNALKPVKGRSLLVQSSHALDEVEERWTGNFRDSLFPRDNGSGAYVQFRVSYFMDPSWHQVRELSYLAVSVDTIEALVEYGFRGKLRRATSFQAGTHNTCTSEELLEAVNEHLDRRVGTDFKAALTRRTSMFEARPTPVVRVEDDNSVQELTVTKIVSVLDNNKRSPGIAMLGVIHETYEKYRIGMREPEEPFLRVSSRIDVRQRRSQEESRLTDSQTPPERIPNELLAYAPTTKTGSRNAGPALCLFMADNHVADLDEYAIVCKLIGIVYNDRVYNTIRKGKVYKTSRVWNENRGAFHCEITKCRNQLNIAPDELRSRVFKWIKALAIASRRDHCAKRSGAYGRYLKQHERKTWFLVRMLLKAAAG